MSSGTTLLFLQSSVEAFSAQERHFTQLKNAQPEAIICQSREEFLQQLPTANTVICWVFKAEWHALAPALKTIHTPAAGADWIAPRDGVRIVHGSFHGPIMAESLLAMMLWHSRRLEELRSAQNDHRFERNLLASSRPLGAGHHFILGYGTIGRACAKLLKATGATITGIKRSPRDEALDGEADFIIHPDELLQSLGDADSLICILPASEATHNLVGPEHFRALKSGAHLYNIGRGSCYREEDLIAALQSGALAGAGLDVFAQEPLAEQNPLWDMPQVFIMPHAAAINELYLDHYFDELLGKRR